ncbi:MAG: class I SAM-dependent methyltransferase [Sphaerochaetaceae bacterium]|nr:class I SAM-dependent methyltransferase [Sphaerochaetaceae bacterium]
MNFLKKVISKNRFNPGLIGIFTNPFYIARKGLYKEVSLLSKYIQGNVLDVGCGEKPYGQLFNAKKYVGLEYDNTENREAKKADFYYDGKKFPFKKNEFDSVVCNEVLEHIFEPDEFIQEINRVLKDNGSLLLTVPFVWDEHEQPVDFGRYSSFGVKSLLERNGFEVAVQRKSVSDFSIIFQLINSYLFKKVSRNIVAKYFFIIFISSVFNILGVLSSIVLPKNNDLYLDNVVLARKVKK